MAALAATLLIVLIALVAAIVLGPLGLVRRRRPVHAAQISELQAQREAKYREIRDAELDHEMGKLLDSDYEEIASALRAEALQILDSIETLEAQDREDAAARELADARGTGASS
ncbi:MAG: hypothetical protein ACYCX7_10525 [Solirubrobacteraceae bacterium]